MTEQGKQKIGMYYYRYPNFGDMLNESLMKKLQVPSELRNFDHADIVVIGSILDKLLDHGQIGTADRERQKHADTDQPIHIWGTGLMFDYSGLEQHAIRPLKIHALRGEMTRQQMKKILQSDLSCVLADPGLLAPYLVPADEKRWDHGIIPHYVDKEHPSIQSMKAAFPNSVIIDVQQEPEVVLKQISQCRTVFSTSLHGLIVADAYNIPNCWCECSDKILGHGYKFHDYFSSFGTDREPVDLREGKLPDPDTCCRTSFRSYREVQKKQRRLLACFPYPARLPAAGLRDKLFYAMHR